MMLPAGTKTTFRTPALADECVRQHADEVVRLGPRTVRQLSRFAYAPQTNTPREHPTDPPHPSD